MNNLVQGPIYEKDYNHVGKSNVSFETIKSRREARYKEKKSQSVRQAIVGIGLAGVLAASGVIISAKKSASNPEIPTPIEQTDQSMITPNNLAYDEIINSIDGVQYRLVVTKDGSLCMYTNLDYSAPFSILDGIEARDLLAMKGVDINSIGIIDEQGMQKGR